MLWLNVYGSMASRKILYCFSCILLGIQLATGASDGDVMDLLAQVSKASVQGAMWLSQYPLEMKTKLRHAESAELAVALNLLYCNKRNRLIPNITIEALAKHHLFNPKEHSTNDLVYYAIGCRALPICMEQNSTETIKSILERLRYFPERGFNHPAQYSLALISLSLYNVKVPWQFVRRLQLRWRRLYWKSMLDTFALRTMALCAVSNKIPASKRESLKSELSRSLQSVTSELETSSKSAITTALLLQAKRAIEKLLKVKSAYVPYNAIRRLVRFQKEDGSFGDIMATTASTSALLGLSLIDIRLQPENLTSLSGQVKLKNNTIKACIEIDFQESKKRSPPALHVQVQNGSTALDVLKVAATKDPCYRFSLSSYSWGVYVTRLCSVKEDHMNKFYWLFYIQDNMVRQGISKYIAREGECISLRFRKVKF